MNGIMSNLKLSSKLYGLLANDICRGGSLRSGAYLTATNRSLSQASKNRDAEETGQKTQEAAEAVKEGAEEVKKTAKVIRNATKSTAKTISQMTNVVSEKATECAESIKGKAKDSLVSGAWNTAKATTELIKDKVTSK